jgi:hypothetical protein
MAGSSMALPPPNPAAMVAVINPAAWNLNALQQRRF